MTDVDADGEIATLERVPEEGTLLVRIAREQERREVILTRFGDGSVAAWENHCQHWTDTRLDRGDGALVRGNELVCRRHGATFDRTTGECTSGPCEGAFLGAVAVTVDGGRVYLEEDGWVVEGLGPAEDQDRSSGSHIGF